MNDRQKFWCDVYAAVAGSLGCREGKTAKAWADSALRRFDERFGANDKIESQAAEIERLNNEAEEYQQERDEVIVALGSRGLLPSEIVGEIKKLSAVVDALKVANINFIGTRADKLNAALEALENKDE